MTAAELIDHVAAEPGSPERFAAYGAASDLLTENGFDPLNPTVRRAVAYGIVVAGTATETQRLGLLRGLLLGGDL